MTTDNWLAISAGATFLLALAAFWTILQNYRLRKKDRELNFKIQALAEINDWTNNLTQAVMNASAPDESSKAELKQRIQYALSIETSILTLAQKLGGKLKEEVIKAQVSIQKLRTTLFEIPDIKGKGFFSIKNEKHTTLVTETLVSLNNLTQVICETRIQLFLQDTKGKN